MYRLLGCISLLLLFICKANAVEPIEFSAPKQSHNLKTHTQYFLDRSTTMTLDEFRQLVDQQPERLSRFEGEGSSLHLGYTHDAVWLTLKVINSQDRRQRVIFDVDYPFLNHIALYQYQDGQLIHSDVGGDVYSLEDRHYRSRSITLPAVLEPHSEYDFLFRIRTPGLISLPMTAHSESSFFQRQHLTNIVLYLIFGVLLGFIFYHLLMYIDNRELSYLALAAAMLTRLAHDLYATGEGQLFTPDAIYWNNLAFAYFASFAAAAALWFHVEFLQLRKKAPRTYWACMVYAAAFILSAQYAYFYDFYVFVSMGVLQLALPVVLSLSTLRWAINGERSVRIYFLGCLLTFIPLFLGNLALLGKLPAIANLAVYNALGGAAVFVVVSFALSSRVKALTEQRQAAIHAAKNAHARDEAKNEFLTHISHEIRTPLNGVLGMIQLLSTSRLDQEQRSWIKIINSAGKTLLNIVNDVLDYSKIEAGRLSIESISFNLRSICYELYDFFAHTEKSGVRLRLDIDRELPEWLMGDPARIRQVLLNLLGNAFKFTKAGEITLRVTKTDSPDTYRISVSDTGIGISEEQREQLFSPFEQTRDDIQRKYGGTGLGLAISKRLTELMGGTIGVDSEVGKGATFWIDLRLPEADDEDTSPAETDSVFIPTTTTSLHVLIAEDNRVNQIVVEKMINKLGHRCTLVNNGSEAVAEIQANHGVYDLVLMDCDMPVKDGYQAARHIRDYESTHRLPRIPIVALTAHAEESLRSKSLKHGMDDHLSKPLALNALQSMLIRHCSLEPVG